VHSAQAHYEPLARLTRYDLFQCALDRRFQSTGPEYRACLLNQSLVQIDGCLTHTQSIAARQLEICRTGRQKYILLKLAQEVEEGGVEGVGVF
jgi:hypothetical protein